MKHKPEQYGRQAIVQLDAYAEALKECGDERALRVRELEGEVRDMIHASEVDA